MSYTLTPTGRVHVGECDFCTALVIFEVCEIAGGPITTHVGKDGAGSDHLATWCGACGPKHRDGRS